jgi:hypothetical protein
MPMFDSMPKKWCNRGRRRSASTITVRWPASAKAMPTLATVVVLPSEAPGLVKNTTRPAPGLARNSMEVTRLR